MNANSKLFSVPNLKEIGRGLTVAVTGAVITFVYTAIQAGQDVFTIDWKASLMVGVGAGLSYLLQKVFRNSNDELFTKENG